jgi:hypothetical protein
VADRRIEKRDERDSTEEERKLKRLEIHDDNARALLRNRAAAVQAAGEQAIPC